MPPVIGWCGRRRQVAGRRGVRGPTEARGTVGVEGRGREQGSPDATQAARQEAGAADEQEAEQRRPGSP